MEDWKEFEKDVHELLRLQGWQVRPEHILGHKKVDAYAEKSGDFQSRRRVVIECKYHRKPLSQSEVSSIFANYLPILDGSQVHDLLLVTLNGLHPSAETYVGNTPRFIHVTYSDLLDSSMDFTSYLQGLRAQYFEGGLADLYTEQGFTFHDSLEDQLSASNTEDIVCLDRAIIEWIDSDEDRPVAVLGGYGMGKSTLARRVAYLLSDRHNTNPRSRIPILIRLEEIATEQSLEGLLGSHFTSFSIVPNYNFHIFMRLNEKGRFVIFLDGFDEMKKTMSWESMRFNLQQLNRLVVPDSRIVLLGRPTAFLNEEEYREALHGKKRLKDDDFVIPGWPDYREFWLRPFNSTQIEDYIKKYMNWLHKRDSSKSKSLKLQEFAYALNGPHGERLRDLASRPVQLKMLLDILPEYRGAVDDLTAAILYSEFIDLVIRREMTKHARRVYTVKDRRKFATSLAYWMWQNDIGTQVNTSELPDDLFLEFQKPQVPFDAVKRDLLTGCFLEKKPPEGLYFPHRSFMEFMVADRLIDRIVGRDFEILGLEFVSPEVEKFFIQLIGKRDLERWRKWLREFRGSGAVSEQCVSLFLSACKTNRFRITDRFLREIGPSAPKQERRMVFPETLNEIQTIETEQPKKKIRKQKKSSHRLEGVTRKKAF